MIERRMNKVMLTHVNVALALDLLNKNGGNVEDGEKSKLQQ